MPAGRTRTAASRDRNWPREPCHQVNQCFLSEAGGPGCHRGCGPTVAGLGPAPDGTVAAGGHRLRVERVGTHVRADGEHVVDSPLGQAGPQVGVGAVGGVGHDNRRAHAPAGQRVERVQSQPPLIAVGDLRP
ncbi:hypothetical protein GCM10010279_65010 [Streptomyces mutabilis]|nr:hypothetical protein GCM10010279_65010 [Streptomyces mutabilis]